MDNIDYSIMDETVDKICKSLLSEPELWSFGTFDIVSPKHLDSIEIVIGLQNSFTSTRINKSSIATAKIFSYEQGKKIREAYISALSTIDSNKQQEILKKINTRKKDIIYDNTYITTDYGVKKETKNCLIPWILFCAVSVILVFK